MSMASALPVQTVARPNHTVVKIASPAATTPAVALPRLKGLPRGCVAIIDRSPYHRGVNPVAIVDPRYGAVVEGLFAIRFSDYGPLSFCRVEHRAARGAKAGWWITGISMTVTNVLMMTDGPYTADRLQEVIVGRLVGMLVDADDRPVIELGFSAGSKELGEQRLLDATKLPPLYAMQCVGDCLAPVYCDGAKLMFDAAEHPEPGDFVVLWKSAWETQTGEIQSMVKRLRSPLPKRWLATRHTSKLKSAILVETLNPPRTYAVDLDDFDAIHKCGGIAAHTHALTAEERQQTEAKRQRPALKEGPK